jgi:hypothetical protein
MVADLESLDAPEFSPLAGLNSGASSYRALECYCSCVSQKASSLAVAARW